MNKKRILSAFVGFLMVGTLVLPSFVSAENNSVSITREVKQYLFSEGNVTSDMIEMYEDGGWVYDSFDKSFCRTIIYNNDTIVVDGEGYEVGDEGNASVELDGEETIIVNSITGLDELQVTVEPGEDITVVENISVNTVMNSMDQIYEEDAEQIGDGSVQIGQNEGERPDAGDVVACNRFNGYLGNGRYYSSQTKSQSITNFYGSDCDWALFFYLHCLTDSLPAKYRYCSLYSTSHYGKCSGLARAASGQGHSKYFHMHTVYRGYTLVFV